MELPAPFLAVLGTSAVQNGASHLSRAGSGFGAGCRPSVMTTLGQFYLQEADEVVLIIQKRNELEPQQCPCMSVC